MTEDGRFFLLAVDPVSGVSGIFVAAGDSTGASATASSASSCSSSSCVFSFSRELLLLSRERLFVVRDRPLMCDSVAGISTSAGGSVVVAVVVGGDGESFDVLSFPFMEISPQQHFMRSFNPSMTVLMKVNMRDTMFIINMASSLPV